MPILEIFVKLYNNDKMTIYLRRIIIENIDYKTVYFFYKIKHAPISFKHTVVAFFEKTKLYQKVYMQKDKKILVMT